MLSSKIPLRWGLGCCLRMLPLVSVNIWWPDDQVSHFHYDSPVTEHLFCSREAQQVCFPLVSFLLSSCTVYFRVHSEDKRPKIVLVLQPTGERSRFFREEDSTEETCGREGSDSSTVLYIPPIALSSLGNWLNRPVFEFWPEVSIPVWRWSCMVSFLSCNFPHEYFIPAPFP